MFLKKSRSLFFLVVLSLVSGAANAASFKSVKKFASESLNYAASEFDLELGNVDVFVQNKVSFVLNSPSESRINTLKQLIYVVNGQDEFSVPESIRVERLTSTTQNAEIAAEFVLSAGYNGVAGVADIDQLKADLGHVLDDVTSENPEIKLYTIHDGNSFGYCTRLALVDQLTDEIAMVATCYAE